MQLSLFAAQGAGMSSIMMIVVMVAVFYFLLIRPQNKEKKKKEELMASLEVNDTVLTTCGFYGVIIDIREDTIIVEFGSNRNCRIPMQKAAILAVEKPGEAAESDSKSETKDSAE